MNLQQSPACQHVVQYSTILLYIFKSQSLKKKTKTAAEQQGPSYLFTSWFEFYLLSGPT